MQRVALRDVDLASFRAAVGPEGCADGASAVARGAVVQMAWEASQQLLTGTVRESAVETGAARSGRCPPRSARPPGSRCGSVRATAAAPGGPTAFTSPPSCSPRPTRRCCPRPAAAGTAARRSALPWEQSLDSLLAAPQARAASGRRRHRERAARGRAFPGAEHAGAGPYPSYSTDNGLHEPPVEDAIRKFKLQARLVQPGRLGGWVAGNLSWSRLDYLLLRGEFPDAHVRLLHELYALYRASSAAQRSGYYYGYPRPATATRSTWTCPRASPASSGPSSSQAHVAGLPFVYRGKQGTVPPPGTAELCLDVTTEGTTLLIAPVIKASDGVDAVPLRFIGTEGHGVIYADREQADQGELARFRLARLTHPVPAQLQQLALADERLVVPEAGQAAFLSRYYPRLRRQATVTSFGRLVHRAGDLRARRSWSTPPTPAAIASTSAGSGRTRSAAPSCGRRSGPAATRSATRTRRRGSSPGSACPPARSGCRARPPPRALPRLRRGTARYGDAGRGPGGVPRWPPRASRAPRSPCAASTPWRSAPRCCPCSRAATTYASR